MAIALERSTTEFYAYLLEGDQSSATQTALDCIKQGMTLADFSVNILQPAMYHIGQLWQDKHIGIAQEHMATAVAQNVLALAFANASFAASTGQTAILACLPENHHSLGLRTISDALETSGWQCVFLGANTPIDALISCIDTKRPDLIALSASMQDDLIHLGSAALQIKSEFASSSPTIVAGGLTINASGGLPQGIKIDEWFTDAQQIVKQSHHAINS